MHEKTGHTVRVLAIVSVVHGELLGEPSAELRAKLADSEVPVLFSCKMAEDRSYVDVNTRERERVCALVEGLNDDALAAPVNEY